MEAPEYWVTARCILKDKIVAEDLVKKLNQLGLDVTVREVITETD